MKMMFRLIIVGLLLIISSQCKKHKADIDQLPPLTHTGAGTFGCLINGKIFLPKRQGLHTAEQCVYQHYYSGDEGYTFTVMAKHENGCSTQAVAITLDSTRLIAGKSYRLTVPAIGSNSGTYFIGDCDEFEFIDTNNENTGELTITHLDETNRTVSGIFNIHVKSANGTAYIITNGRFDQPFNQ